jgi:uncharacterized membrane protein YcjF (UPF0283 family)
MKSRNSRAFRDLIILIVVSLLTLAGSLWIDPFARTVSWIYQHDNWKMDELFTFVLVLVIALAVYSWRRWHELEEEIRQRQKVQDLNRELAVSLETTRTEVRTLRGILPICESCQRIQDGANSWITLELYLQAQSQTRFAHGLCPECARKAYGTGQGNGRH